MIGKLFDRFIEWSLNRQEEHLMKKPKPKRRVSRVRRKANTKKK
jgi:hypothetical protein